MASGARRRRTTAQAAKPERTIVVYGVPDGILDNDIMVDILMIHFQKAKNKGGDVEAVVYPTSSQGVAYITFEDERVAENVLKNEHQLEDRRLHKGYLLKVSLYGESVFTCVTCILSLSILREKCSLEDLVEDLKKNLPKLSFGPLDLNGKIRVQGPFLAINALQNMLLLKIKSSSNEQNMNVKEIMPEHRPNCSQTKSRLSLEPRNDLVPNASREELSVTLDTDIYHYMKKFKNKFYENTLEQYGIISNESLGDEITTIYLRNNNTKPGPSQLEHARNIVESLSAELHNSLRKTTLPLKRSTKTEKQKCEQACKVVSTQYPNVLVTWYSTHIDIIGSSSDIYKFTQEVKKMTGDFQKEPWR
ncbi:RNA-binding protein 43 isoform X2 [Sceloporus undulatus]|uniref:RNA-binding protein 43 isoform X2 n=1 Tax=Sceloporus undulatus TaxID=8520 RepID=UPI001C4CFCA3|nr:RNA-binding protein 43 isoform X2 [Sceloporus undulatus]